MTTTPSTDALVPPPPTASQPVPPSPSASPGQTGIEGKGAKGPQKGKRPPKPKSRGRSKADFSITVKETDWNKVGFAILGVCVGLAGLLLFLWVDSSQDTDIVVIWEAPEDVSVSEYRLYVTRTPIENTDKLALKLDTELKTGNKFYIHNITTHGTRWLFKDPEPGIYYFIVAYPGDYDWEINEKVVPPNKNVEAGYEIQRADHTYLAYAIMLIFGPFGIFFWLRERKKNRMEEKFSDFLRDLAEYWKVGLSMSSAIDTISRGEYGALNKEVKKMAIQLSWGVSFNAVLKNFVDRIKTSLVERSVSLILEANRAGGKISDVLVTASADAQEIKWIQTERQKGVKMYVTVIYISFFVYLAVIAIIVSVFLPSIIQASSSMLASGGGGGFGGMEIRALDREFLTFLFFCSVLVQSVGNGLMAGIMGEGRILAGFKHVFLMTVVSLGMFMLMVEF